MEFKHIYIVVQFIFIDCILSLRWAYTIESLSCQTVSNQIQDKINELHSTLKHIDLGYYFFVCKICGQLCYIG